MRGRRVRGKREGGRVLRFPELGVRGKSAQRAYTLKSPRPNPHSFRPLQCLYSLLSPPALVLWYSRPLPYAFFKTGGQTLLPTLDFGSKNGATLFFTPFAPAPLPTARPFPATSLFPFSRNRKPHPLTRPTARPWCRKMVGPSAPDPLPHCQMSTRSPTLPSITSAFLTL